jgi:hypothetical protein
VKEFQTSMALSMLRSLGTPAELRALVASNGSSTPPLCNNAHIHLPPNFSAFDSTEQALTLAAKQGVKVLGVSNYYDYHVYNEFQSLASIQKIFPLFGLEIIAMQEDLRDSSVRVNDPGNPGKTYLCGKGITRFDDMSPEAQQLIVIIRRNDSERMAAMIDRMRNTLSERGLASTINEQAVIDMVVQRHDSPRETVFLQERHISQAFQEEIFRQIPAEQRLNRLAELLGAPAKLSDPEDHVGVQNELRSHLMKAGKPAFVAESFLSFPAARRLVLELGGIPSYPVLADGAAPVCEFEADPEKLIAQLQHREVYAAEWIPARNKVEIVTNYVTRMRNAGFVITAGTEHNTLDLIPFEPSCKDGPLPEEIRHIFWEGACVVAAHQFLSARGECGYVDAQGHLNPAYPTNDERIRGLAHIGRAVIQRYFETSCTY